MHLMWRQQLSLEILHDHVLSYSSVILIFSYGMVQKVAFVGKTLLRTSALVNQGRVVLSEVSWTITINTISFAYNYGPL